MKLHLRGKTIISKGLMYTSNHLMPRAINQQNSLVFRFDENVFSSTSKFPWKYFITEENNF